MDYSLKLTNKNMFADDLIPIECNEDHIAMKYFGDILDGKEIAFGIGRSWNIFDLTIYANWPILRLLPKDKNKDYGPSLLGLIVTADNYRIVSIRSKFINDGFDEFFTVQQL